MMLAADPMRSAYVLSCNSEAVARTGEFFGWDILEFKTSLAVLKMIGTCQAGRGELINQRGFNQPE